MDYEKIEKIFNEMQEIERQMKRLAQQYFIGKLDIEGTIITFTSTIKAELINKYNGLKTTLANKIKELP